MNDTDLLGANERLAVPPEIDFALSRRLGFFVVGRLAKRHGIRVQLRHSWYGGVTALVLIPMSLFLPGTVEAPVGAGRRGRLPELESPTPGAAPVTYGGAAARWPDGDGLEPAGPANPGGGLRPAREDGPLVAGESVFTTRISDAARLVRATTHPGGPPPASGATARHHHDDDPRRQGSRPDHQPGQQASASSGGDTPSEARDLQVTEGGAGGNPLAGYRAGLVQGRVAADGNLESSLGAPPPLSPPITWPRHDDEAPS